MVSLFVRSKHEFSVMFCCKSCNYSDNFELLVYNIKIETKVFIKF